MLGLILQKFDKSDINCALALSQIKKIPKFLLMRKKVAKNYDKLLKNYEKTITRPSFKYNGFSSWHLYQIKVDFKKLNLSKSNLISKLLKKKIVTQVHYIPIYDHKIYKNLKKNILKNSKIFYEKTLSLPIFVNLKYSEQKYIIKSLVDLLF